MSGFFDGLERQLRASARERHGGARRGRLRGLRARRGGRLLAVAAALLVAGGAVPAVTALSSLWEPDVAPQRPWATAPADVIRGRTTFTCRARSVRPSAGPPIGRRFTDAFSVFARPQRPRDGQHDLRNRRMPLLTIDFGGIRRLGFDADRRPIDLVPGWGIGHRWAEKCVRRMSPRQRRALLPPVVRGPAICVDGGCTTLSELVRHGMYGSGGVERGRATITTVVPDGVRAVRVTYGSSTRTFPIEHNFASFRVGIDVEQAASPDRLEWLMRDGSVRDVTFRPRPRPRRR